MTLPARATRLLSCIALIAAFAGDALAQTFPSRPITMVIPFAPGGPTDVVGRLVGEHMSRTLGQPIVVENTAGAAGQIAALRVVNAPPDGHTIFVGTIGSHAAAVALNPALRYRPLEDFAPIGLINTNPIFLAVRRNHPATSLGEFVTWLRANQATANNAHAGIGSPSHMGCLLFNAVAGVRVTGIAYRGLAPAMADVIAGQVDYVCDQAVSVAPQHRGGTVKVLAVASPTRVPALSDVPTGAEGGLPGFDVTVWNALFAPRETPPAIVERLTAALQAALADAIVRARLEDGGASLPTPEQRTPPGLRAFVAAEIERWTPIIRAAGVTVE